MPSAISAIIGLAPNVSDDWTMKKWLRRTSKLWTRVWAHLLNKQACVTVTIGLCLHTRSLLPFHDKAVDKWYPQDHNIRTVSNPPIVLEGGLQVVSSDGSLGLTRNQFGLIFYWLILNGRLQRLLFRESNLKYINQANIIEQKPIYKTFVPQSTAACWGPVWRSRAKMDRDHPGIEHLQN
ncbi:hypothetical protein Fot_26620 [Forsythia ovata]|uniref:Uncharacterized protein n=1 Tax=Forsythia ovata TaxID=205694 RepID=A0ABD1UCM7_9LAMI